MDGRTSLFESSVPLRGLAVYCDIEGKRTKCVSGTPERQGERRREKKTFWRLCTAMLTRIFLSFSVSPPPAPQMQQLSYQLPSGPMQDHTAVCTEYHMAASGDHSVFYRMFLPFFPCAWFTIYDTKLYNFALHVCLQAQNLLFCIFFPFLIHRLCLISFRTRIQHVIISYLGMARPQLGR
jgi:hypothetical protein